MKKAVICVLTLLLALTFCSIAAAENVAKGKTATQSSTGYDAPASRAVDGNTDGQWYSNSVNHTNFESSPWWQVDLGASYYIDSISIWNRTDCCGDRLSDYYVFVSDSPFTTNDVNALASMSGVGAYYNPGTSGVSNGFTVKRSGRYVRVQLKGTNYLHMAEVEVFSSGSGSTSTGSTSSTTTGGNVAQGKAATQSSNYNDVSLADKAVDGNTNGEWYNYSITHTNYEQSPWWQVDLGSSYNISTVKLWNRTDCCSERLSDFYVFVSNNQFSSNNIETLKNQSGVSYYYYSGQAGLTTDFNVNKSGRYVRVQLSGSNYHTLAEVQVFSTGGGTSSGGSSGTYTTPSLSASGPSGGNITVNYTGAPGYAQDWVGIYKVGASDSSYISWQYLNGNKSGTLTFAAPKEAGSYHFRMFQNNGYTLLATSNSVTIGQSTGGSTSGGGIVLRATAGDGKVNLEWTDNSYSSSTIGYNLFRGTSSGGETSTPITDFIREGYSYSDPNVVNGTYYCYVARPVYNNGSMGPKSNEACATPTGYSGGGSSGGSGVTTIVLQINNPYMTVNGSVREIDPGRGTVPILYNARTLLPIRSIVEAIGGTISWTDYEQKVTIQYRGTLIELWIGNNNARVNGVNSYTDVAPQLNNARTMLPLRFIAENLGADVNWDGTTETVTMIFR